MHHQSWKSWDCHHHQLIPKWYFQLSWVFFSKLFWKHGAWCAWSEKSGHMNSNPWAWVECWLGFSQSTCSFHNPSMRHCLTNVQIKSCQGSSVLQHGQAGWSSSLFPFPGHLAEPHLPLASKWTRTEVLGVAPQMFT